eukprot:Pgem_evm1s15250
MTNKILLQIYYITFLISAAILNVTGDIVGDIHVEQPIPEQYCAGHHFTFSIRNGRNEIGSRICNDEMDPDCSGPCFFTTNNVMNRLNFPDSFGQGADPLQIPTLTLQIQGYTDLTSLLEPVNVTHLTIKSGLNNPNFYEILNLAKEQDIKYINLKGNYDYDCCDFALHEYYEGDGVTFNKYQCTHRSLRFLVSTLETSSFSTADCPMSSVTEKACARPEFAGMYWNGSNCVACEAGFKCTKATKENCQAGTYSLDGASMCTTCPSTPTCKSGVICNITNGESTEECTGECHTGYHNVIVDNVQSCKPQNCTAESFRELEKEKLKNFNSDFVDNLEWM